MTKDEVIEIIRDYLSRFNDIILVEELVTAEENPRRFAKTDAVDGVVTGIFMGVIENGDLPDVRVVALTGNYAIPYEVQ